MDIVPLKGGSRDKVVHVAVRDPKLMHFITLRPRRTCEQGSMATKDSLIDYGSVLPIGDLLWARGTGCSVRSGYFTMYTSVAGS